jgi:hypothetical protein
MPTLARGTALRCTVLVLAVLATLGVAGCRPGAGRRRPPGDLDDRDPGSPTVELPTPGEADPAEVGGEGADESQVTLDLQGGDEPSKAIVAILLLTVLSLAPALLS